MVLPADLVERVAHHVEEIFVGAEDAAVHAELGHGLRLADGRDLAAIVRVALVALAQSGLHGVERAQQLAGFIFAAHVDLVVELAVLDGTWPPPRRCAADAVMLRASVMRQQDAGDQRGDARRHDGVARARVGRVAVAARLLEVRALDAR